MGFIMLRRSRLLNFATSILHQTSLHSQCLVSCLFSCHYFPVKPSISLYLPSTSPVLCSTTRLLLYNSISECVSAETEAVSGDQSCYVAELHTKFDPGNRLTNPWRCLRSLPLSEAICRVLRLQIELE